MPLQCGIVGLPNVGKSSIFNALTRSSVPADNYPFCTIDPHLGIVELPDVRLLELQKIYKPEKVIASTVEFIDIAGLVKGASSGEGLGNQFLSQIRQTSAIIHVVRCFDDKNINHVDGMVDPIKDIGIIETELLLSDIDTLEKRKTKLQKVIKSGKKDDLAALDLVENLIQHCSNGKNAKTYNNYLKNTDIVIPHNHLDSYHTYHLYVIRHPERDNLQKYLYNKGVQTSIHYPIIPQNQKAYASYRFDSNPIADQLAKTSLSLPIFPALKKNDCKKILNKILLAFK